MKYRDFRVAFDSSNLDYLDEYEVAQCEWEVKSENLLEGRYQLWRGLDCIYYKVTILLGGYPNSKGLSKDEFTYMLTIGGKVTSMGRTNTNRLHKVREFTSEGIKQTLEDREFERQASDKRIANNLKKEVI